MDEILNSIDLNKIFRKNIQKKKYVYFLIDIRKDLDLSNENEKILESYIKNKDVVQR